MKKSEIYYSLAVVAWFAVVILFITHQNPRLPYTPFLNLFEGMFCGILPAGIFFALGMCAKYDEIERKRIKDIEKRRV